MARPIWNLTHRFASPPALTLESCVGDEVRKVKDAIREGGESYFRYRQIEMLPMIAPAIAQALAEAKLITIAGVGDGAPGTTASRRRAGCSTRARRTAVRRLLRRRRLGRPPGDRER